METTGKNQSINEASVIDHAIELLNNDDVSAILDAATSNDSEKQIALEFVKSYVQFLQELVEHDLSAKLMRSDIEVRDLISHVNIMMKKKYEAPFTAMVFHSAQHYRSMQARILAKPEEEKQT
jgi:hypothetical protein